MVSFHFYSLEFLYANVNKQLHFTSALTSQVAWEHILLPSCFYLNRNLMIFEWSFFLPASPKWVTTSDGEPSSLVLEACLTFSLLLSSLAQLKNVPKPEGS